MRRFLSFFLYGAAISGALTLTACNREFSPDDPLPEPAATPSLFIGSDNQIIRSLDVATGKSKWEVKTGGAIVATPFIDSKQLVVITETGIILRLDPKTGTELGRTALETSIVSSPVSDGQLLYFGGLQKCYGYDFKNDVIKWSVDIPGGIVASPVVSEDRVYVGTLDGSFYALKASDGSQVWQFNPNSGGKFASSAGQDALTLYVTSTDSNLYALDKSTGEQIWSYKAGNAIYSSPLLYGGNIIFGADDYFLHCVSINSRNVIWKAKTKERIRSSATAANNVVYAASYDNFVYAFDIIDGEKRWAYGTNRIVEGSPLLAGKNVCVGSYDGRFYALDTATGTSTWDYRLEAPIRTSAVYSNFDRTFKHPTVSGAR